MKHVFPFLNPVISIYFLWNSKIVKLLHNTRISEFQLYFRFLSYIYHCFLKGINACKYHQKVFVQKHINGFDNWWYFFLVLLTIKHNTNISRVHSFLYVQLRIKGNKKKSVLMFSKCASKRKIFLYDIAF